MVSAAKSLLLTDWRKYFGVCLFESDAFVVDCNIDEDRHGSVQLPPETFVGLKDKHYQQWVLLTLSVLSSHFVSSVAVGGLPMRCGS